MGVVQQPTTSEVERLVDLVAGRRWVALTGAGLSTDSGIPDYRGPNARATNPIQYADFMRRPEARRRYWARSLMGYRSFGTAVPNGGHEALAALGVPVITQNVDGLHSAAGSRRVVDLHGLIDRVICMDCGDLSSRSTLQLRLEAANPEITGTIPAGSAELRPDGDADIADPEGFIVPACELCSGLLKPDVVFFGESVPLPRVAECYALVDEAEALVVAGSSLTVMSGLRFVRHAAKSAKPVAIVNQGATRGDELATVRVAAGTTQTLQAILSGLTTPSPTPSPTNS